MINHVVVMTFRDPADAEEAERRLLGLRGRVEQIRAIHVHRDTVGAEGSAHLLLHTRHDDVAGLRAYQGHPEHLAVAGWLRAQMSSRAVIDWEE